MISNNTMRISGLASGMNTDEIVANLVKAQSYRLIKMQQTRTQTTWKSDSYRDVNKKVDEFRKSMESLRLQSTFNKQAVTSSDSRVEVSSAGTSTQTDIKISAATLPSSAKPATVSFDSKIVSGTSKMGTDISFKLNNVDITLTADMTFDQAIAKINESSGSTNVKAANVGGSLVLTTLGTGATQAINISSINPSVPAEPIPTNPLGIMNVVPSDTNGAMGKDATSGKVTINGTEIVVSSNKFTFEGVTFNLKENIEVGSNITVQVGSDTQGIFDNIKKFVDKYNELIADFNGKVSEKRYRDFPPLTEDQKKDMKENDIKLWDEKAKSGLLTNDSTIKSFLTEMRNSLSTVIEGATSGFNSLRDIGINFSSMYTDNGKLVLDEAKLKGVLQTNKDEVKMLFASKGTGTTTSSTTATDKTMHVNSGFGWRIYDRLNVTISQLGSLAGSPNSTVDTQSIIAKQIKALDANLLKEQQKINAYEQRQWKQFTAMEKALAQLNSQSSWLSQQIGM
jgi:flagellar hook-associated protein 2